MYILEPIPHETLWGGTRLNFYTKKKAKHIGHLYLVNGHKDLSNKILNGNCAGISLFEAFQNHKEEWNLSQYMEFPLTIALVDATENLSIQVHPDNMTAKNLEGRKIGKTESWVFMEAPVSGWIYNGCSCNTKEEITSVVNQNKIESVTQRIPIDINDYVSIEAGTLHAITAGSLVYEIEYGSDFTYRFYDYNRRDEQGNTRELHIEKALLAIKPEIKPSIKKIRDGIWISEKNYEICRVSNLEFYKNHSKEIECISIIKGEGFCENYMISNGMSILLFPGECIDSIEMESAFIARIQR